MPNTAPVITSNGAGDDAAASVAENTAAVTTVTVTDPDGPGRSFGLSGADAARFQIDQATGALTFVSAPNFEAPTDQGTDNVYNVTVTVNDGAGGSDAQNLAVTVTDVAEPPPPPPSTNFIRNGDFEQNTLNNNGWGIFETIPEWTSPIGRIEVQEGNFGFGSPQGNGIVELDSDGNSAIEQTVTLTAAGQYRFSLDYIMRGTDPSTNGFEVFVNGVSRGIVNPTTPGRQTFTVDLTLAAGDNVIRIAARGNSDGVGTLIDDVSLVALSPPPPPPNVAPVITSNGGGETATVLVEETFTGVAAVTATDADGPGQTFAIIGGADQALFTIEETTGVLRFATAPDFEAPTDTDTDGVYEVQVQVADGAGGLDSQTLSVRVADLDEVAPLANNLLVNGDFEQNGLANAGFELTESLPGWTSPMGLIEVQESAFGNGNFNGDAIIELDSDANSTIEQTVTITAPGEHRLSVKYNPRGDDPTTNGFEVFVDGVSVGIVTPTIDAWQVFTVDVQLTAGSHVIQIAARGTSDSSGTLIDDVALVFVAPPPNVAPAITSNGAGDAAAVPIAENTTAVTTVTVTDPDGPGRTFSLSGADAERFQIDQATGALSFVNAPNFEAPADQGTDNVYNVTVTVNDGAGGSDSQSLAITVSDVNDAPVVVNPIADQVVQTTVAFTLTVPLAAFTDEEGDTLSFSATLANGDPLPAWLSFDAGARTFSGTPATADEGAIEVRVTASDGNGGTVSDSFAISVSPVVIEGGAGFATIQAAVDAAQDGDVILIAPGTYVEQVTIEGFTDLTLRAIGPGVIVKAPADVTQNATDAGGNAINAVIAVVDSNNVVLESFGVDGDGRANTVDGPGADFVGVYYRNSSGALNFVDITGVRDPYEAGTTAGGNPVINGVQRGQGLFVDNDAPFTFAVDGSTISDFQKTGAIFLNAVLDVNDLVVTGGGAQTIIAQNGIQVGNSSGVIENTVVTDIGYAGPALAYSGLILAYDNGDLTLSNNTLTGSNNESADAKVVGVFAFDGMGDLTVTGNIISFVDTGIGLYPEVPPETIGTVTITGNTVTDLDENDPFALGVDVQTYSADPMLGGPFTVTGTPFKDVFQGGEGGDNFSGQGGEDVFQGGGGNDALNGDGGFDVARFVGVRASYTVTPTGAPGAGDWTVTGPDGTDTLTSIEGFDFLGENDAPLLREAIADQSGTENDAFSFVVPETTFIDVEGDALTYSATLANGDPLPSWLSFDPATRTFAGTPPEGEVLQVRVTADDGNGGTGFDDFTLTIGNVNDAPAVANPIADQAVILEGAFTFTVPVNTFADVDGDTLTYTATLANGDPLPSWLSFDAGARTFSGTPPAVAVISVTVTASDAAFSAADSFNIAVSPVLIQGRGGFATIQAAVDAAEDGDVILVAPGTYAENVTVNKAVTILGANAGISGNGMRGTESTLNGNITIAADGITIDGLRFDGGQSAIRGEAVANAYDNLTIRNNLIENTTDSAIRFGLGTGGGIGSDNWIITDNKISDIVGNALTGMVLVNVNGLTVTGNVIEHDLAVSTGRRGINLDGVLNATVTGNTINMGLVAPTDATVANPASPWAIQIAMSDRAVENVNVSGNTLGGANSGIIGLSQRSMVNVDIANNTISNVVNGILLNTGGAAPVAPGVTMDVDATGNTITAAVNAIFVRDLHDAAVNGPVTFAGLEVTGNIINAGIVQVGRLETSQPSADGLLNVTGPTLIDGSDGNDTVQVEGAGAVSADGGEGNDTFQGGDGADTFNGEGGNDTFSGSLGADTADGGMGFDIARFAGSSTLYTVAVNGLVTTVTGGPDGVDTLTNFEAIDFMGDNQAPLILAAQADQTATENALFSFTGPAAAFFDVEGDAITYAATLANGDPLPAWISFDPATRTFSGTPPEAGVFELKIIANDGNGGVTEDAFTLTIGNVNDAPAITSDGGGATAALDVAENTTAVTTVTVTDPDGPGRTFALSGDDAGLFQIDQATGALSFVTAPDFEAPGDQGADNVYDVTVTVDDGSGGFTSADDQYLSVTVTDETETPLQQLYFTGNTNTLGQELWRFDGTTVSFVADIAAGVNSSNAGLYGGFAELGGKVYFTAYDAANGDELRVLDPATGTVTLVDIYAGPGSSFAGLSGGFVELGGKLYFTAYDPTNGNELRVLDPATGVVSLAADIFTGSNDSYAGQYGGFIALGGKLYFTAADPFNGFELRVLDPTSGTVSLVADIYAGSAGSEAGSSGGFTVLGGKLYFTAYDPTNGNELRVLDPATGTVSLVADIAAGGNSSNPGQIGGFVELGGKLYFGAEDAANGLELRVLDPATGTVSLVADIYVGDWSYPGLNGGFVALGGKLYFSAQDANGFELRVLDPATGAVSLVADIYVGPNGSAAGAGGFAELGGKLYFMAQDAANGAELRVLDPATGAVSLAADIVAGTGSSYPREIQILNGELVFTAQDAEGRHLFSFDGTTLTRHTPAQNAGSNAGTNGGFVGFDGAIYYSATDSANGQELRSLVPGAPPTGQTFDIVPGADSSQAGLYGGFVELGGKLYFAAFDPTNGTELRVLDPATGTVSLVADLNPGTGSSVPGQIGGFEVFGGKLYFTAYDTTNGYEVRVLDPATGTVSLVADIRAGAQDSFPGNMGGFIALGGKLYFNALDGNGWELRVFDPATGTVTLVDIYAGPGSSFAGSSGGFAELGGKLYFTAEDPTNGFELRVLDPATGMVSLVADIAAGAPSSYPGQYGGFVELGGKLYFGAEDAANGLELRVLDPATGTVSLVADISAGAHWSLPGLYGGLVELGGKLYFTAFDAANGDELRVLDPATGTVSLVADILPGAASSNAGSTGFIVYDNALWFAADDGVGGTELYKLSATGVLTQYNLQIGPGSSNPGKFAVIDGRLVFQVTGESSGKEFAIYDAATDDFDFFDDNTAPLSLNPTYVSQPITLPPLILDLDGDGAGFGAASFDFNGDGRLDRGGWVEDGDAFLALDRNGDGAITTGAEISFAADLPGAVTDLEGLVSYDTNGDGALSAADARFGEFRLWADDGDGVSEVGELVTLSERGVISISLRSDNVASTDAAGNRIFGWTDVTMADGSVVKAADASLAFESVASVSQDVVADSFDFSGFPASLNSQVGEVSALLEQALTAIDPSILADVVSSPAQVPVFTEVTPLLGDEPFRF